MDALNDDLPQDNKTSMVEMSIIEAETNCINGHILWLPPNLNPADALTKVKGSHVQLLLDLLQTRLDHAKAEEAQSKSREVENRLQPL